MFHVIVCIRLLVTFLPKKKDEVFFDIFVVSAFFNKQKKVADFDILYFCYF